MMRRAEIGHGVGWMIPKGPTRDEMLHALSVMWTGDPNVGPIRDFPGANPTSLMSEDVSRLALNAHDYVVAPKTDGVRYWLSMCIIEGDNSMVWLCDRALNMILVRMELPKEVYFGTLLDAELVQRRDNGRWDLMVFDAIAVRGKHVGSENYTRRLELAADTLSNVSVCDAFDIQMKPVFGAEHIRTVFDSLDSHSHPIDGIIITPISEPIRRGLHPSMFKAKPAHMHTADLEAVVDWEETQRIANDSIVAVVLSATDPARGVVECDRAIIATTVIGYATTHEVAQKQHERKIIVECAYADRRWVPFTRRHDKSAPNSFFVVQRTARNVSEAIWDDIIVPALMKE